jgi:hypothetical protein
MNYEIARATFDDRSSIVDYLSKFQGNLMPFKGVTRWDWAFERNPFRENAPTIWLAVANGIIVGQYCGLMVDFKIESRVIRGIWGIDFSILPVYQGFGIGDALMKKVHRERDLVLSLFSAPRSNHLKRKNGAQVLTRVPVFTRALRKLVRGRCTTMDQVVPVTLFGNDLQGFLEAVMAPVQFGVMRTARYLNWKYLDQPFANYVGFVLRNNAGSAIGCSVLRCGRSPEPPIGLLAEVLTLPGDEGTREALITHAIEYFIAQGMKSMVAATTDSAIAESLIMNGLGEECAMPVHLWAGGATARNERTSDPHAHLFCRGDSDWDQFPAGLVNEMLYS